ncbi:MAG: long-chain fatty acid--CoA ligase [Pyrinomonadaceae bacterium]
MLNLSAVLENSALKYPDKPAFALGDNSLTYGQLNAAANQVANGLRAAGIAAGDTVAISCPNLPYFPIIFFGILKAGAVVVPLSVLLKTDEIAYHLEDSGAKAYFCFEGTAELPMGTMGHAAFSATASCGNFYVVTAQPGAPSPIDGADTFAGLVANQPAAFESATTGADDTAVIIYTSGTTGKPKGAELSHSNLFLNAMLCADFLETSHEDVQIIVLPLFHVFALTVLMMAGVYRSTTNVLVPRFDAAAVFDAMQKHSVTVFAGVPTMYWALLDHPADDAVRDSVARNLRIAVSGGASLPIKVLEEFEERFGVPIYEGYGMSEGSPVVTFNQREFGRKPGSVGTPVWGVEVKIVDAEGSELPPGEPGELLYRGHNVMKGYHNRPDATAETIRDGWLHSGDIAYKDEDGFFFIVDRTKDLIIRGGMNVYPREVEEAMTKHEAVSLVAVIGVADEKMGEEVKAVVVLKEEMTVTEHELIEWTKERIAVYKCPRTVEFVGSLPMSATGKILKKELRS